MNFAARSAIVLVLGTVCSTAFAHKVAPEKVLRQQECTTIRVVLGNLAKLDRTVVFTADNGHKFYSIFDIEGRVELLTAGVKAALPEASKLRGRASDIIATILPSQKWRINGGYEYKYYAVSEVDSRTVEASKRLSEVFEDNCSTDETNLDN